VLWGRRSSISDDLMWMVGVQQVAHRSFQCGRLGGPVQCWPLETCGDQQHLRTPLWVVCVIAVALVGQRSGWHSAYDLRRGLG
jgi:hypothetical protein